MTSSGRHRLSLMEVFCEDGGLEDNGANDSEGELAPLSWDFWYELG